MVHLSILQLAARTAVAVAHRWLLAALLLAASPVACAQVPVWSAVAVAIQSQPSGTSLVSGVATDGSGNVFVTGSFTGQAVFGSTVLTSAGGLDIFVAKYEPGSGTWAWAQRAGGIYGDQGGGLAVRGSSVYVVGSIYSSLANKGDVRFGTTLVRGATATPSTDIVLAKYLDNGSSATLVWTQVGGGLFDDSASGVAVSGPNVYITGFITNNKANSQAVVFGGSVPVPGASTGTGPDLLLAKYVDNGPSAALGWAQVGGGLSRDEGFGVAASGTSVYVTGTIRNTSANTNTVLFGDGGTPASFVPVAGISPYYSQDLVLAKYVDNGPTAALAWTQVAGGQGDDTGYGVAVRGTSVYVTGSLFNTARNDYRALFGGGTSPVGPVPVSGASSVGSSDLVLAKYVDNGPSATLGWTQVGGGQGDDAGYGVAVGDSSVYVTGYLVNSRSNSQAVLFGGNGTAPGMVPVSGVGPTDGYDLLLAKYVDHGSRAALAWTQVGGDAGGDMGYSVAVSGQQVYAFGIARCPAAFGTTALPAVPGEHAAVLTMLTDPALAPLVSQPPSPVGTAGLVFYPNPASGGTTTLVGAVPGAAVQVLDVLGRLVYSATASASGTVALAGLAAGHYLVRVNTGPSISEIVRLSVE